MKPRKTSYRQNNFEKEQSWRYFAPGFDLWYKAILAETVQCWQRIRHIDQWDRIESLEINPHIYEQSAGSNIIKNRRKGQYSLNGGRIGSPLLFAEKGQVCTIEFPSLNLMEFGCSSILNC